MARTLRLVAAAVIAALTTLSSAPRSVAAPAPPSDLSGLWQARHVNNTADVRGVLILQRDAAGWEAQIDGFAVPARVTAHGIAFELPQGKGAFFGRPERGGVTIFGRWAQAPTVDGGSYAFPVRLRRDGPNEWRGSVEPLADPMTFYLSIAPAPTGAQDTMSAFLDNPERNLGRMWDVDRVARNDTSVQLLAAANGPRKGRIVADGTYREDAGALSLFFDGRGGTYDFTRVAPGAASDFYPRGRPNAPYRYVPPPRDHDGCPVGNLRDAGISQAAMEHFVRTLIDTPMDSVQAVQIHGILIARHGRLVLEEYFHGQGREAAHDTRSAAKSITATLFGATMLAGYPVSPATAVYSAMNGGAFPPNLDPLKRKLVVEDLLTMSSGLDCDDNDDSSPGNEDTILGNDAIKDYYAYTLSLKMIRPPGQKAVYCSIQPNLVGGVLARVTHRDLFTLFEDLVAKPMQIETFYLPLQPLGEPYMGGGVRLRARDFMKFPQMMLDGGTWNGRRIVSRWWALRASSPLTTLGDLRYGYFWWVATYPYRGGTLQAFFAGGNGGQIAMAIPKLDLVVTAIGGNYNARAGRIFQQVYVPKYILPAVER